MGINLQKGQRISLSKEAPGLTKLMCGLGWDTAKHSGGGFFGAFNNTQDCDLDASVLCLDENGKIRDTSNLVYFGNLSHKSGAITHLGDNLTGAGDGDDEQVLVDLSRLPKEIVKLVFTVNIYDCIARKQEFTQVKNAFVRLVNTSNNQELAKYNLSGSEYKGMTGMIMAEIYNHNNEWKMAAIGNGINVHGLEGLVRAYA
ncbi:stress protein [Nostoc linckia z18]|uniref:Stress protein n=2 Tax=Nostoc linckia TaxID=92942 RepID=A0A9Q5ZBG6_NOSLI|nr:TerD family protein [Nostoc linckia]PHK36673.1 stress protein [Nostoc linckia z15]PHK42335.1 stress protein [Nostoc linckia z16]PHJ58392.1 stress protein [Nostoc linckia z1]PHJ65890.1 stress protein [Nostoc linckia z2]PHJ70545.1 stress protein [Nostoc linckia z3]